MGFICVHAGAGIHKNKTKYEIVLKEATFAALKILEKGGSALDAVTKAIESLENDGITNCGKGSVLNIDGEVQCDASLMQSVDLNWAGVGAISNIKNPILIAKELILLQQIPHPDGLLNPCFLTGIGAIKWAKARGFELCYDLKTPTSIKNFEKNMTKITKLKNFTYENLIIENQKNFENEIHLEQSTSDLHRSIQRIEEEHKYYRKRIDEIKTSFDLPRKRSKYDKYEETKKDCNQENKFSDKKLEFFNDIDDVFFDTVGAVAIDDLENIASGVSSGGIIFKDEGRIGQSGMYGCGCWAEDNVGVSTSGVGEYLIKTIFAKKCSKKLIKCEKIKNFTSKQIVIDTFDKYFLNSRYLKKADHLKQAGILAAILHKNDKKVEVVWAHNSPTMCVSFATKKENFVMEMSKSNEIRCTGKFEIYAESCLFDI